MSTWPTVVPFRPLDEVPAEVVESVASLAFAARVRAERLVASALRHVEDASYVDDTWRAYALADWASSLHTRALLVLTQRAQRAEGL